MALMERVATLMRANLNDLVDRAEDPEKMIKQVILDMQNQLMQVKTQVAIAIADEHLLMRKQKENEEKHVDWVRKAELAVDKKDDQLARAALDRSLSSRQMAENFRQQAEDQAVQVENLKSALQKLEQKLGEAVAKSELMLARHRRARALDKAADAHAASSASSGSLAFDRMKNKVERAEALSQAKAELLGETVEDRLASLERQDQIERLLTDLKARKALTA
jgi:phage shock protein A